MVLSLLPSLLFTSCAENVGPCPSFSLLPQDQRGSFLGKVKSAPVSIIADSDFSGIEFNQIEKSVNQWNTQGVRFQSGSFFSLSTDKIPNGIRTANPRECSQHYGTENSFYIVKESSLSRWASLQLLPTNPGATIRCGTSTEVSQQIIYVNGDPHVMPKNQVMSVVLHELGHALGLDHSCAEGAGSENFKGCGGLSSDHPYHQAVMFPILNGNESKEILMPNDSIRTQCLYGAY